MLKLNYLIDEKKIILSIDKRALFEQPATSIDKLISF